MIFIKLHQVSSDKAALALTSEDILPYIVASLPRDIAISASYNISELIMRCIYNGVECKIR